MKRITIIGTGISGLSAGWFLKEKYKEVELTFIEKKDHPGGLIRTIRENNFLFELGPRGFRPTGNGIATLEIAKSLGLENQLIYADAKAKKRYLYQKGKLKEFSLFFLLKSGLFSGLLKDFFSKPSCLNDESIVHFMERKFNRKLLENVMDPLVKGIFGGDPETLSMKSCFPYFWNLEKKHGSLVKGLLAAPKTNSSLVSFKEGMQTLTDTLTQQLDARFYFSQTVEKVEKKGKGFLIHLGNVHLETDFLILAIPDHEIARLFSVPTLINDRVSLSTVSLGWLGHKLPLSGYGFLVPSREKKSIMGMTFDSDIFPDQDDAGQTRITAMIQGENAQQIALSEIESLFHLSDPDVCIVQTHTQAIPQYTLGYEERFQAFKKSLPTGVFALGNHFQGVSVNDCIQNAKSFAQELSLS